MYISFKHCEAPENCGNHFPIHCMSMGIMMLNHEKIGGTLFHDIRRSFSISPDNHGPRSLRRPWVKMKDDQKDPTGICTQKCTMITPYKFL